MAQQLPIYLFTGFLESGKTSVIQETMEDERFNTGEKTLILLCEEGEVELDVSRFYGQNVYIETVENEADLSPEYLQSLTKNHKLDRIIIEYNGMWQLRSLFENLPSNWFVFQSMMFADATTFLTYNANMRSLVFDKIANAEMVVFNRASDSLDKLKFHQTVRETGNRRCQIVYEYPDGKMEYDDIEDPLPFDKEADVIVIEDDDFALFYQDLSEDLDFYHGKRVKFKGIVARDKRLGAGSFILGRHIMTCCADDIQFGGLICKWKRSTSLKARDWVIVTAKVSVEYNKLYGQEGPVLVATRVDFTTRPDPEVVAIS